MFPVLQVSNLSVELNDQILFQNLSFDLQEGETLVVVGRNGAGKTVLVRALLGLVPYRGKVTWRPGVTVGYVPQRVPLDRDLPVTVSDFFGLRGLSRDEARRALSDVSLGEDVFLDRQLGVISSGQFQRVLIAWALVGDPNVLIFDEPNAGIDAEGEEEVHALLERTQKQRSLTMILVTHDQSVINEQATRVLRIAYQRGELT